MSREDRALETDEVCPNNAERIHEGGGAEGSTTVAAGPIGARGGLALGAVARGVVRQRDGR